MSVIEALIRDRSGSGLSAIGQDMSDRILWSLPLGMLLSWVPALLGRGVVARVSEMYDLAAKPYPYIQFTHAGLLYVITPMVVISGFILFLSPGATLILAMGQARRLLEWLVLAFGTSTVLLVILGTSFKLIFRSSLSLPVLLSLWIGTSVLAWMIVIFRSRRASISWPTVQWLDVRRILWMLGATYLGVVTLVPKIFWENFNVDGIEAFEFGRSLTNHVLPYWDIQDGVFGFYHNFVIFAYPNHWFITIFGTFEAAVRLPFILYVVTLFAALTLLIELRSKRSLSMLEEAAIWLGLVLFTVVQVYNSTYEPFFSDIAESAAPDILLMVFFVSACYALFTGRLKWCLIFALMTYLAGPGGLLLLVALAGVILLYKSPDRGRQLKILGVAILACLIIGLLHQLIYNPVLLGGINDQFSTKNMLRRLFPPTLTQFVRFNALIFPSGILPALFFLNLRRKSDSLAWIIAGCTVLYFGVIYIQAWTALHQFTPVMVLPLVVFWRQYLSFSLRLQRWLLPAVAATTVLSLVLSLPRHFQINQAVRQFGQATEYKVGSYDKSYEQAVRSGRALYALLPENYRLKYPEQPWGTDPHSWVYYANRKKPNGTVINYVVQSASEPPPPMFTKVMVKDAASVYVRDLQVWQRDRNRELPRVAGSPLYEPILRRTYQFFREYVERKQKEAQQKRQVWRRNWSISAGTVCINTCPAIEGIPDTRLAATLSNAIRSSSSRSGCLR